MAFQPINPRQAIRKTATSKSMVQTSPPKKINLKQESEDLASRKILEEIQMKKQILLKQGAATALNSSNIASALPVGGNNPASMTADHLANPLKKVAMQQANTLSFGYFVPQETSFGNLILPVLPRFTK